MSERGYWPHSRSLVKEINGKRIYLGYGCDLTHGRVWFCRVIDLKNDWPSQWGHGEHRTNKLTAVRLALEDQKKQSWDGTTSTKTY